jgi:cytidine deaminase
MTTPYACSSCARTFARKQHLQRHEALHARNNEEENAYKPWLRTLKSVSGVFWACRVCNATSANRFKYQRHWQSRAHKCAFVEHQRQRDSWFVRKLENELEIALVENDERMRKKLAEVTAIRKACARVTPKALHVHRQHGHRCHENSKRARAQRVLPCGVCEQTWTDSTEFFDHFETPEHKSKMLPLVKSYLQELIADAASDWEKGAFSALMRGFDGARALSVEYPWFV